MNKLIKYFNKTYGVEHGNIEYPRNSIEMYEAYQVIKDLGVNDNKLTELLINLKLPKPKTLREREMYSECINNNTTSQAINIPLTGKYYMLKEEEMSTLAIDSNPIYIYHMKFDEETIELLKQGGDLHVIVYDGLTLNNFVYTIINNCCIYNSDFINSTFISLNCDKNKFLKNNYYGYVPMFGQNCLLLQGEFYSPNNENLMSMSLENSEVSTLGGVLDDEIPIIDLDNEETFQTIFTEIPNLNSVVGIYFEPKPIIGNYEIKDLVYPF